jgi:hypothetical protein
MLGIQSANFAQINLEVSTASTTQPSSLNITSSETFKCESVQVPCKLYTFKHSAVTVRKVSKTEKLQCKDCRLAFIQSVSKYRHVKEVYGSEELTCDECGKKCNRRENLARHNLLKHHITKIIHA